MKLKKLLRIDGHRPEDPQAKDKAEVQRRLDSIERKITDVPHVHVKGT